MDAEHMASAYGSRARRYAEILDASLRPAHERLVALGKVAPDTRVLDLATGTGAIARIAAAAGADVVGVDISPGMIDVAQNLSRGRVCFEVADAAALSYAGRFDVVTCGFGLSHMPDIPRVLDAVRRSLVPGGRFVESSWGAEGLNPSFSAALAALKRFAGGRLHTFVLDEDTWADPSRGSAILAAAFEDVGVATERLDGEYASVDAAIDWTLAWPDYGESYDALPDAEREDFWSAAREAVAAAGDLKWWFAINYYSAASPQLCG